MCQKKILKGKFFYLRKSYTIYNLQEMMFYSTDLKSKEVLVVIKYSLRVS